MPCEVTHFGNLVVCDSLIPRKQLYLNDEKAFSLDWMLMNRQMWLDLPRFDILLRWLSPNVLRFRNNKSDKERNDIANRKAMVWIKMHLLPLVPPDAKVWWKEVNVAPYNRNAIPVMSAQSVTDNRGFLVGGWPYELDDLFRDFEELYEGDLGRGKLKASPFDVDHLRGMNSFCTWYYKKCKDEDVPNEILQKQSDMDDRTGYFLTWTSAVEANLSVKNAIMASILLKHPNQNMWRHLAQSLNGNYHDWHAQLGKILGSCVKNVDFRYNQEEFERRDNIFRYQKKPITFELCEYSRNNQGCPKYWNCHKLHKAGTDWQA